MNFIQEKKQVQVKMNNWVLILTADLPPVSTGYVTWNTFEYQIPSVFNYRCACYKFSMVNC